MPKIVLFFYVWIFFCCYRGVFKDPAYFLYLYISLYFLNPYFRWWGHSIIDLRYSLFSGLALFFFVFLNERFYSHISLWALNPFRYLVLFYFFILAVWPIAIVPAQHEYIIFQMGKFILIYFTMLKVINSENKYYKLITVFLIGQFYLGWVAWETGRNSGGRLENIGPSGALDANFAAAAMVVSIPLLFHFMMNEKKIWIKVAAAIASVFLLNAIILINSRASFLGVIASMGFFIFRAIISPVFKISNKLIIILLVLIGLSGSIYLMDDLFIERMATLKDPSTEGSGGRIKVWAKGFDVLSDYPFGVGRRGFAYLSPQYLAQEQLAAQTATRAIHNTFLQALTDLGYMGFCAFLLFIASSFLFAEKTLRLLSRLKKRRAYSHLLALQSSLVGYLITIIFINGLYTEMLYILSALLALYTVISRNLCFQDQA